MENLFQIYEVLARSGLFDADFYLSAHPDVAALNVDPLLHYVERGAREGRRPRADFDVAAYLEQCRARGEEPANPLLHFIRTRAAGPQDAGTAAVIELADASLLDFHCDEIALTTKGSLRISGWLVCTAPVESISVLVDGVVAGAASTGLARPDVARLYRKVGHARDTGFAFRQRLEKDFEAGEHQVLLRAVLGKGSPIEIPLPVSAVPGPELPAEPESAKDENLILAIELPEIENGAATAPITNNLIVSGWALAREGVKSIDIAVDGRVLISAHHGLGRIDVARQFPDRDDALQSGLAAFLPNRALPKGPHRMSITLVDNAGRTSSIEFAIRVEELPEGEGPWNIRGKMPQAEIDLQQRVLAGLKWRPAFHLAVRGGGRGAPAAARATLESLRHQAYPNWQASWFVDAPASALPALRKALLDGDPELARRVRFVAAKGGETPAAFLPPATRGPALVCALTAGDVLGCDALLELAISSGLERGADFFYSDERRRDPASGRTDAYFKPGWSPDLLLSTNYVGRLWAADAALLKRSGNKVRDWLRHGDFDLVLQLAEQAKAVRHLPKVLCATAANGADTPAVERKALTRALQRRGIAGVLREGCAPGIFRVQRARRTSGRVSILIPTCAARGLVRNCIESLRKLTAYRNVEIICIENIPPERKQWKRWLRQHADKVIETTEPFNWSRYNNLCVAQASGEFLLFLNDDVEATDPTWLDTLLAQAERPEVGAVGPQLLYPDGTVQHAGFTLAELGRGRHIFRHAQHDDPGYFGLALTERNVIGVTGACLLVRRDVFEAVGGFDESHGIVNNDVDFCLRTWERGYVNVYTPHATLLHHELASRAELGDVYDSSAFARRWRQVFLAGDPYLNPNLSRAVDDLEIEREPTRVLSAGHPLMAHDSVRRILVVKLDHIGDCLTALPAVRRLKRHFPKARLTVLANRATRAIWNLEPAIEAFLDFDFFHARSGLGRTEIETADLLALQQRLAPLRFDLAVDLRKVPDTRHVLPYTGARYLAGFDSHAQYGFLDIAIEWEGDAHFVYKRQHVGDDLLRLVDAIATSCVAERSFLRADPRARLGLPRPLERRIFAKPVVCVHPASGNELRQWPAAHFAELVDMILARHDVHVVFIGGPDETALVRQVSDRLERSEGVFPLAGKLKLTELPALIARCVLFIGNNSGPKHLAAALGVPTIGVHSGVVDSNEWGPLGDNAVAIRRDMSCSPCYAEKPINCPNKIACLNGLGAGAVYRQASRMLAIHGVRSQVAVSGPRHTPAPARRRPANH